MKALLTLLMWASLLWSQGAWPADCASTDYSFLTTQAEVDALGATGCDRIVGELSMKNSGDITNLNALTNITSIGEALTIDNLSALIDLDGLDNLTSVGELNIATNGALTNLNGLASLTSVGGDLVIGDNAALTNLDGLANVTSVGGNLLIFINDAVTNLDGLTNINSVGGGLTIESNAALANLDGLTNINSVGEFLTISDNVALANIDGLTSVTSVGGFLTVSRNDALTNLDGLASLTSVGGGLSIDNNAALTNLNGLASLSGVEDSLTVEGNAVLANCQGLAPGLGWPSGPPEDSVGGSIAINTNSNGCNSIEQILSSVSGPTQPIINAAEVSSTSISVGFTASTATEALFPITGYTATCIGSEANVSGSPASDILDNTPIQETLTVTGFDPISVLSSIEVDIDITHSDPTDLYITLTTPQGTELVLWNLGTSGGEDLVGTFPTTLTPVDSLDSVTRQAMDGDWVLSIEDLDAVNIVNEGVLNSWGLHITEELARTGTSSPIELFAATRGRDYTCTVAPNTQLGSIPASDPFTVSVPLELPAAPTIVATDFEDSTIRLTVSVADDGGADITEYAATCTDGSNSVTGNSATSEIAVTGLTNGTAYTCTVTAANVVGVSGASAATDSITPEATAAGLPVWLLYEATK